MVEYKSQWLRSKTARKQVISYVGDHESLVALDD
jgi:hypothetical protein